MGKVDEFLAFINVLIKEHFTVLPLAELEILGAKTSVYHVFQSNFDIETIYFHLLALFESEDLFRPLIPELMAYYQHKILKHHEVIS